MNQYQIDRLLKWGIVSSIFWLAGIGSLFALISGLRAKRAISASDGMLVGSGKALWCIVAGSLGLAFWLPVILTGISHPH